MRTAVLLASMLCLVAPAPTAAYDIRTRIKIGNKTIFYLHDVHESITRLAEQCLPPEGAPRPTQCWTKKDAIAELSESEAGETYGPASWRCGGRTTPLASPRSTPLRSSAIC